MTSTGTWSSDYKTLNNNHYTCFSNGTTCTSVYYVYFTSLSYGAFYITLTNGKKVEDALDEMFNGSNVNVNNSDAKTTIDNWYNTNLSNYTNYIEDTIYCNDRSISQLNGWDPNGGDNTKYLCFSPNTRTWTYAPSLVCSRTQDRFTVSSSIGNGKLTYPIGLITSDEVMYAGGRGGTGNSTYYLFTNQIYWVVSPNFFNHLYSASEILVSSSGLINYSSVNYPYGLRPVISLKSTDVVASGDGTSTNPYVIKTS